jgi:hypothetical protein
VSCVTSAIYLDGNVVQLYFATYPSASGFSSQAELFANIGGQKSFPVVRVTEVANHHSFLGGRQENQTAVLRSIVPALVRSTDLESQNFCHNL